MSVTGSRSERPSKEVETLQAWLAAAREVPELTEVLRAIARDPNADERVRNLVRNSLGRAGIHFGTGISQGTRVAVLRSAVKQVRGEDKPYGSDD